MTKFLLSTARLAAALGCAGSALAQGVIEGHVALPPGKTTPVMSKRYDVVTVGGVVAPSPPRAVVYVEGPFPPPATNPVAQIIQKDYRFQPALLPVRAGTRVEFVNADEAYHSVFSYSPAKRFDLGRYRPDERPVPSEVFPTSGVVTLRCDIHEHMRGLVVVVDTPYFTTTDASGHFRLEGVPPGAHVLKAWINGTNTLQRPVEVRDQATVRADFP